MVQSCWFEKMIMSLNEKKPRQRPRPRPKQKLSAVQERLLLKIIAALFVLALLWILFAPGTGLVTYMTKRSQLRKLEQETAQIRQKSSNLEIDIEKLENDPQYLERIARKDHGLLKKNERVFDFSSEKVEKDE
jgi:cell division protein FtsB